MSNNISTLLQTLSDTKASIKEALQDVGIQPENDITKWANRIKAQLDTVPFIEADYLVPESGTLTLAQELEATIYLDGELINTWEVEIPDKIGQTVHAIFRLPDGVTDITNNAFYHNQDITSMVASPKITKICDCAVEGCPQLTSVYAPGVIEVGDFGLDQCPLLTSITLSPHLVSLGNSSLCGNTALQEFDFGDSLETVGDNALADCTALQAVTLPATVTLVDERAFANCKALTSVQANGMAPRGMKYMFTGCTSLQRIDNISFAGLTAQPTGIFSNCKALDIIDIRDLGTTESITSYPLQGASAWGTTEEGKSSLLNSIYTYSFNRASSGYHVCTVILAAFPESWLDEDDLGRFEFKGYAIA